MKPLPFLVGVLAMANAVAAFAQSIGPVAGPGPGAIGPPFTFSNGHLTPAQTGIPTINAACGTSAVIAGTDFVAVLTSGTSSSASCTVTFAVPYNKRPVCNIDAQAGSQPNFSVTYQGIILSGVADSTNYNIQCIAQPGG